MLNIIFYCQLCIAVSIAHISALQRNIILIITDDQDVELGSMQFMPKTLKLLKERGVEFTSGFVTTPICCPSRTTILSGKYVHNHNVHTNNGNCSGQEWKKVHERSTFGVHVQNQGYTTAYLGKYLNEYDGSYVPPGWDHWFGLVKNSKFYNYTVNANGIKKKFGFDHEKDYFTDVITNRSLDFLKNHIVMNHSPFLLVLSYPAPHGPEDPAPKYSKMFDNIYSHRTESWNYAPNPDKQWLLQHTGKMEPVHVAFTDFLHRRRLQTLQSVDDGVHKVFSLLRDYNQLASTYVIYTSDHGYHLGQFGLIKGKNMPYEFDIKVPYLFRGPGIPKNVQMREPVSNVDIAPTLVDIAGGTPPSDWDGRSLLNLIAIKKGGKTGRKLAPWRDTVLVERGKMPKLKKIRERWLKQKAKFSKVARLNTECAKEHWQGHCAPSQSWKCYRMPDGRWRIYKCRSNKECNCRRKRYTESEEEVVDEFLLDAHRRNILHAHQWFQGNFNITKPVRRVKRCSCSGRNSTHPLKFAESTLSTELFAFENLKKPKRGSGSTCHQQQMNCFVHGPDHWRTPPLWPKTFPEFCFCQNSNNNTYWCLRTVNATHNFLYCEFVTEFVSYYDLNQDPYQLVNAVYSLEPGVLEELSERLQLLRSCKGDKCENISRNTWKLPEDAELPVVNDIVDGGGDT